MENFKVSDFSEDFLIAKEIEEGCAPSTIKAYRYDLNMFISFIGDLNTNSTNSFIYRQQIRLFLKKLKDLNYSKKGIARKIATLRSFFKFLTLNKYISENPMDTIKTPKIKIEESLPKFLDLSDIETIFRVLKKKGLKIKKVNIYYIIIRLLYSTMARVSELCNIKIKDIDFSNGYITLRGKGNKQRLVPIDQNSIEYIDNYIKERDSIKEEEYLLLNIRDNPLTPRVVQSYISDIKKICGFPSSKIITPHIFRHTGATHLRRSGMDISELQDILGHSNPNTTRIYVKNSPEKLAESYKKMHPLNNKLKSA